MTGPVPGEWKILHVWHTLCPRDLSDKYWLSLKFKFSCFTVSPHSFEFRVRRVRSTMSSQQISVPHGPDRQRILNVLAQRRYRKNQCLSLPISYSLYLGQRKRERLQSLETRLDARLGGTDTMYASNGEIQLQQPMQPPLTSIDPIYDLDPDFMIGASNACLVPYESACNTSETSPSYVSNQFGTNTIPPYGMP